MNEVVVTDRVGSRGSAGGGERTEYSGWGPAP